MNRSRWFSAMSVLVPMLTSQVCMAQVSGGSISRVTVNLTGKHYIDVEAEARAMLAHE